jgi:phage-related protein
MKGNLGTWIKEFAQGVLNFFKNPLQGIKDIGKNIVEGLWKGITGAKDWLLNKIKGFAKTITKGIKDFFGIKSPSKVMREEVGQWLPKGIAVGIDANTDSALNSIDRMNDEIMNKMNQAVNMEMAKASFSGTSGSVSQILSANSVIQVENYNTLELDGEVVYENQQQVQQRKDLQYGFGGGNSK